MKLIDPEKFEIARLAGRDISDEPTGIGTRAQKTLHVVLKRAIEPDPARREVPVGPYVADIFREGRIIEVQTRNFYGMKEKLAALLEEYPVSLVYPSPHKKWICWVDPETGEISPRHHSPKVDPIQDLFWELLRIKPLLPHPNLTLHLVRLDMLEYRNLDGRYGKGKIGSTRNEAIPLAFHGEILLQTPRDYWQLLPDTLPDPFTAPQLAKAARLSSKATRITLNVLQHIGSIQRSGKKGNAILYTKGQS